MLIVPAALDGDPTETAVPWAVLTAAGHAVDLATASGAPPQADPRMLTGEGLALWSPVLRARRDAVEAWTALIASDAYRATRAAAAVDVRAYDALVLPGGHAPRMREHLESAAVHDLARAAFEAQRVVGAICHGVVVLARARDAGGRSVLWGRQTTALTAGQELLAWQLTRAWLGTYYRTYPQTVEAEVTAALQAPTHFHRGPAALLRDAPGALGRGFVVEDGDYVSARWPGDAYRFSQALVDKLHRR